jgi:hypothetical protein
MNDTLADKFERGSEESIIYGLIHDNPTLQWLNNAHMAKRDNRDLYASADYYEMKKHVTVLELLGKGLCCVIIISFLLIALLSFLWGIDHAPPYSKMRGVLFFGTLCDLGIAIIALLILDIHWDYYIELRLNADWQTKDFSADFKTLYYACALFVPEHSVRAINLEITMRWFQTSGDSANMAKAPQHVIEACQKHLHKSALHIRKMETSTEGTPTHQSNAKILAHGDRDRLKNDFRVFKKFKILPESEELRHYYASAEEALKEAEVKA